MNASKLTVLFVFLFFAAAAALTTVLGNKEQRFTVIDTLVDSQPVGTSVVAIVEIAADSVNLRRDSAAIRSYGNAMMRRYMSQQKDTSKMLALSAMFYGAKQRQAMTAEIRSQLSMVQPGIEQVSDRLDFIRTGVAMMSYSKPLPAQYGIPQTQIVQTYFPIPKQGITMKSIMDRGNPHGN